MIEWSEIKNYYMNEYVIKEIIDYSKNRWIALETNRLDQRIFISCLLYTSDAADE